jgi:hypothetical protein
MKQRWRGREQGSGKTERECVCERLRMGENGGKAEIASVIK